jgi:hypothetical protein
MGHLNYENCHGDDDNFSHGTLLTNSSATHVPRFDRMKILRIQAETVSTGTSRVKKNTIGVSFLTRRKGLTIDSESAPP